MGLIFTPLLAAVSIGEEEVEKKSGVKVRSP